VCKYCDKLRNNPSIFVQFDDSSNVQVNQMIDIVCPKIAEFCKIPRLDLKFCGPRKTVVPNYQNCSVLYCVLQLYPVICTCEWAVLTGEIGPVALGLVSFCVCFVFSLNRGQFICHRVSYLCFCVLFGFLWLSVPVQSIVQKDLSPKWPVMCWEGHKSRLTVHVLAMQMRAWVMSTLRWREVGLLKVVRLLHKMS